MPGLSMPVAPVTPTTTSPAHRCDSCSFAASCDRRWNSSRLNTRYQPALHLADLILAGDSFEQRVGDLQVSGFVFDMWKIYEDFVCVALREAMASRTAAGRHCSTTCTSTRHAMSACGRTSCGCRTTSRQLVVDAKYKAEKPSGFPQADLYQLLAYCTVLGLREGHLVYAKGNEDPRAHSVIGADVTIRCHTLDLAQSPAAVLEQVASLAERITSPISKPADGVLPETAHLAEAGATGWAGLTVNLRSCRPSRVPRRRPSEGWPSRRRQRWSCRSALGIVRCGS